MADLQNITPVYYDSETKTHKPMGEGQVVDPKHLPDWDASAVLSKDKPNYLTFGSDGGLKLDGNDVLSNGISNLLTISPVDGKIQLDAASMQGTVKVVSDDAGNLLSSGSDSGAYLSLDDMVNTDNGILFKDPSGRLSAGLTLGYNGLTGKLSLYGAKDNELSNVTIVAAGSMLIGAEFTHGRPDPNGNQGGTGDYTVSLSASYNSVYDSGVGLVFKGLSLNNSGETSFTYNLLDSSHNNFWPQTWEAFFNGDAQSTTVENSQASLSVTFADQSTLTVTEFNQVGMTITGKARFTPKVGIKGGYYLHMIFRLASGVVTDTYLDFTDIVSYSAGCGISINDQKVVSIVASEMGGIKCEGGAIALTLPENGAFTTDEEGLKLKTPEADSGLVVDDTGLHVDKEWLQDNYLGPDSLVAGDGIDIQFTEEKLPATVSAKTKAAGGLTHDAGGLSVDESWLDSKIDSKIENFPLVVVSADENNIITEGTDEGAFLKLGDESLEATDGGLKLKLKENSGLDTEGGLGVKTNPDGGLTATDGGLGIDESWLNEHVSAVASITAGAGIDVTTDEESATVAVKLKETNSGLETTDGLAVKANPNGGLEATEEGLGVKTDSTGGLEAGESGLKVKIDTDGGLQSTDGGLGIDKDWLKQNALTEGSIVAGNGIGVSVVEGAATITAKPKDNGGISVDESGIALKVKPDASLTVDAEGLSITTADGDSPQDTDVVTYGWLKDHLTKVLSGLIADNSALTVGEDGKLNVTIVSADTGNLLGLGKDKGAYMHGDLNKGPNSDEYEG